MRTRPYLRILPVLGFILTFLSAGCYTQVGTVQDRDREDLESYTTEQREQNEENGEQNEAGGYREDESGYPPNNDNDYWYPRYHVGFSYYYPSYYWPSYAFSVAYADPWFYDRYWSYDPWWCGTPYLGYSIYGYPYYSYPYYSPPFYRYRYASGYVPARHGIRGFGPTRGNAQGGATASPVIENRSSGRGVSELPTGAARERVGGTGSSRARSNSAGVRGGSRTYGNQRSYKPRGGGVRAGRGSDDTQGSGSRGDGVRDTRPAPQPNEHYTPPPASHPRDNGGQRDPSHGHRDGGSARGNTPSYSPPPSRGPSTPPPSSGGGSAPARSGSRSGSRGGRP